MIITGKVIKGKGKGKILSYPTVNIRLEKPIDSGVYDGIVTVDNNQYQAGVFIGPDRGILEAYLLDFEGDLYGKIITVRVNKKIREVMKFKSDEEARGQIKIDIANIKNKN